MNIDQNRLRENDGLIFVVHGLTLKFRAPARYDDMVYATARVSRFSAARFYFEQRLHRDSPDGPLLVEGEVEAACLDGETFRPRRLPRELVEAL